MKILTAAQIREIDQQTIALNAISSLELMEQAAGVFVQTVLPFLEKKRPIHVLCGSGNNGGDGFVIARRLLAAGFDVKTYTVFLGKQSDECRENQSRVAHVTTLDQSESFPQLNAHCDVIDALLGVGTSRAPSGVLEALIRHINHSEARVFAVDVPSGLPGDFLPDWNCCIRAAQTFTFQFPKLTFFLKETAAYAGNWQVLDIGLHPSAVAAQETSDFYLDPTTVSGMVKPRARFSHKGTYGHGLLIAGSKGKTGAAVLSARAAFRSGIGLLTVHVPESSYTILQATVPEAMCLTDQHADRITRLSTDLTSYSAVGIGPGIGTAVETLSVVKEVLAGRVPVVLDADALNLLAENPHLLDQLPEKSILTPHPKEFERLAGTSADTVERLELLRKFAACYRYVVVLKDAITAVALPSGTIWFNTTGNPGMATGGSGDVLTGIILGLLAQGYTPEEAACMGVFFHGKAGEQAAEVRCEAAVIAGDLVDHLRIGK